MSEHQLTHLIVLDPASGRPAGVLSTPMWPPPTAVEGGLDTSLVAAVTTGGSFRLSARNSR